MALQFEELDIWKQSRVLCKDVYRITNYELFSKDFRLRDQIRASSGSIMDNIAEGFERNGNKEFIQFLYIAKGSSGETRSQLYRALDNNYIHQEEFNTIYNKVFQLSKSISGFIQYLKNSQLTGHKNLKS
ncbi:MAG: four helix bundle protein [Lentimicrobiaceae bacterium]|nr:four helix bundle protein [Lentimicrobiaceae bacterium]